MTKQLYSNTCLPILKRKSQLYQIITNGNRTPDYLAINLYWDTLRSWYGKRQVIKKGQVLQVKKLKTPGIFLRYSKLSQEFSCSQETIRKKFVKLEQLGLIQRDFQHRRNIETKSFNQLLVYVWQENPHFISTAGISRTAVPALKPYTNHQYIEAKYGTTFKTESREQAACKCPPIQRPVDTKKLRTSSKEEVKNRSTKSIFDQKTVFTDQTLNNQKLTPLEAMIKARPTEVKLIKTTSRFKAVKPLSAFYPLSKEDNEHLQLASGREFSLRAMNEILLHMSKKIKDRWFGSKKRFLSYMAKVFQHERRDAVKVSHESFRIKSNQTAAEATAAEQEAYLAKIEYSLQVSPEWHFKKKLCSVLERESAYPLLQAYQRSYLVDDVFKLHLSQAVALNSSEQALVLAAAQATQEFLTSSGEWQRVGRLEFVLPPARLPSVAGSLPTAAFEGLWGKIRQALIASQANGEALDRSWFGRLVPAEDAKERILTLTAPTAFIRDWIQSHYAGLIDRLIASHQYSYRICS